MFDYELSKDVSEKLDKYAEEGESFFEKDDYDKAIEIWKDAIALIPEPKNCYSEMVWFLASIGDVYFLKGKYEEAYKNFQEAENNNSGEGVNNPFVLLRIGQCAYELELKEESKEYLLKAYMLEGEQIFEQDDSKYFDFLKTNIELDK